VISQMWLPRMLLQRRVVDNAYRCMQTRLLKVSSGSRITHAADTLHGDLPRTCQYPSATDTADTRCTATRI